MTSIGSEQANELLALAKSHSRRSRQLLLENISDLFLSPEGRLTDQDRASMAEILGKLVEEVEVEVRQALAERLAVLPWAPHELVLKLSADEASVARPLLLTSQVLRDPDLIELVKHRTREHRLAIAMRSGLGAAVGDALVEQGEDDVIEALIRNQDAVLSRHAIDYLVEESRRIDRFQEPLLQRKDLPTKLAYRMFWWVSAALRQRIVTEFKIDESDLDDAIESAVHATVSRGDIGRHGATSLAAQMHERGELTEPALLRTLRLGHIGAFIAGLGRLAGVDLPTARRSVLAESGEALAACCKAAGFSRNGFATIFLLTREARAAPATAPALLDKTVALYDIMNRDQARRALRYWMRDAEYLDAVTSTESIAAKVDT